MYKINTLGLVVMFFVMTISMNAQIYVSEGAINGNNDGSSWGDAYTDLGTALAAASDGDEVWVAFGIYKPPVVTITHDGVTDETRAFVIDEDIKLYGGFFGGETSIDQRAYTLNPTVLDGDIQDDDLPGDYLANRTDNARHVVYIAPNVSSSALVDGFFILNGAALGDDDDFRSYGGGICHLGNAQISGLTIQKCAAMYGGGIYTTGEDQSVRFSELNVDDNYAVEGGTGIYASDVDEFTISNSKISRGRSGEDGYGALLIEDNGDVTFSNLVIRENQARAFAAVFIEDAVDVTIDSVLVYENNSFLGTVGIEVATSASFSRVAITDNRVDSAAAGLVLASVPSNLTNVLIGNNTAGNPANFGQLFTDFGATLDFCTIHGHNIGIAQTSGSVSIQNSIVYGGNTAYSGAGPVQSGGANICNDNTMDGYLTQTTDMNNTDPDLSLYEATYFMPRGTSPAIDASANSTVDLDVFSKPRIGTPEIGAVEFDGSAVSTTNIPDVSISAYPTITDDVVTVKWDNASINALAYHVINNRGQLVHQGDALENGHTISLGNLATGAYQIIFIAETGRTTRAVIVK